ncbi:MAG: hypothetical protein QG622_1421 [Actinomycetota bacterium]|nr:hypothetical protein [Actinomycetota bacterium]
MPQQPLLDDAEFAGIRGEFVLKVDGDRPILYPMDYSNTNVHYLLPTEGLALSLFDGRTRFSDVREVYLALFPDAGPDDFDSILRSVDERVRRSPSTVGIGADGVFETSPEPIGDAIVYEPRDFVVSPEAHAARLADPRTRTRLDLPINVYTVFTHHCVTRCLYCYAERSRVAEMPLERWEEILDELVELGIHLASPDNGDTLARPDGLRFLEMLLERDLYFLLSTKAHLGRGDVERLLEAGLTKPIRGRVQRQVQLSIDAVDPEVSRRLLGTGRSRIPENQETLENFLHFGVMPIVKGVITGLNVDQILPIVEAYYPLGARRFSFVRYTRTFHRHRDELYVRAEHLDRIRRQVDTIRTRYPDITLDENLTGGIGPSLEELTDEQRQSLWANRIGCGGGWMALGVSADGAAFLCEQMVIREPFVVGDARTQSIREIWESDALRDFVFPVREQFEGTPCHSCPDFEECLWVQGRCYRDAFFAYGSVFCPPPLCPRNDRS